MYRHTDIYYFLVWIKYKNSSSAWPHSPPCPFAKLSGLISSTPDIHLAHISSVLKSVYLHLCVLNVTEFIQTHSKHSLTSNYDHFLFPFHSFSALPSPPPSEGGAKWVFHILWGRSVSAYLHVCQLVCLCGPQWCKERLLWCAIKAVTNHDPPLPPCFLLCIQTNSSRCPPVLSVHPCDTPLSFNLPLLTVKTVYMSFSSLYLLC